MAATEEMTRIAMDFKPRSATLVPERREEITTEGGLDVLSHAAALSRTTAALRDRGILVSMFIDPDPGQVRASRDVGADAIEIHTGAYCEAFRLGKADAELYRIRAAAAYADSLVSRFWRVTGSTSGTSFPCSMCRRSGSSTSAQHIARALFLGLAAAVREIADLVHGRELDCILGIGVDIVDISRVERLVARYDARFLRACSRKTSRGTRWERQFRRAARGRFAVKRRCSSAGDGKERRDPVA
jgi:pyridoxine 5-phosphate synthase